jgi:hypothetical protein
MGEKMMDLACLICGQILIEGFDSFLTHGSGLICDDCAINACIHCGGEGCEGECEGESEG